MGTVTRGYDRRSHHAHTPSFVSLTLPPMSRHTTPVIKKSLNPSFPPADSTFDMPLYLSLAGVVSGRGLEVVVWDKVGRGIVTACLRH